MSDNRMYKEVVKKTALFATAGILLCISIQLALCLGDILASL
jgi:hypothetical protein